MEHLRRNTNNDRLIYTIEKANKERSSVIEKELVELVNRVVTVVTGILSSVISGSVVGILKNDTIERNGIVISILFISFTLIIWYIFLKFFVPHFSGLLNRKINIAPQKKELIVKQFNTEVMQRIAEIDEIVDVIATTDIAECKMLNYVITLYKYQEVIDFLLENIVNNKMDIRKSKDDGTTDTISYAFNEYTISAVMKTLIHIEQEMDTLIEDPLIKSLDGYELLKNDLGKINKKLEKLKKL